VRRIFFTQEMASAIKAGRKTATTRDHQKALGEYEACTGNYRRPPSIKPFAVLVIDSNSPCNWGHSLAHFTEEGFASRDAMLDFVAKHPSIADYQFAPQLYYHTFAVRATPNGERR
jgi:hypothetical protein